MAEKTSPPGAAPSRTTSRGVPGRDATRAQAPAVDLVVLAGGRATRLDGQDKAALVVGGSSLLDRLLAQVGPGAPGELGGRVVVVGRTPVPAGVLRTVEDPPGGGPVAGVVAGLDLLDRASSHQWVAVAAVDQPEAGRALAPLRQELAVVPRAVQAVRPWGSGFEEQWLLACYRREALREALRSLPQVDGARMRDVAAALRWMLVLSPADHLGDLDTWADKEAWERRLDGDAAGPV